MNWLEWIGATVVLCCGLWLAVAVLAVALDVIETAVLRAVANWRLRKLLRQRPPSRVEPLTQGMLRLFAEAERFETGLQSTMGSFGHPYHRIVIVLRNEIYVWRFQPAYLTALCCDFGRKAADPELNINWKDASELADYAREHFSQQALESAE